MRFRDSANYGVPLPPMHGIARTQAEGGSRRIGLGSLPSDFVVLLAYIILSRCYIGDEARLGVKIGGIPIFITDAVLVIVVAISMCKHPGRLLNWAFGGGGAGAIGRAVWLLFLMAVVYFVLAVPVYGLLAARDLAIFGYCLFFPLTCFALTRRTLAVKLVRYFIYATCLGAVFFNFQKFSGISLFDLHPFAKGLGDHELIPLLSAGNLGDDLSPALAGLFAYMAVKRERRILHTCALLLCLFTLAQMDDRSSVLGFVLASGVMFVLGAGRSRLYLSALAAGLAILLLLSVQGALPVPGGAMLHRFSIAMSSGADFQSDPDSQFRFERWRLAARAWMTSPVFGVGFGAPILSDEGVHSEIKGAAERGKLGAFNVGMPHNTFLMVLARIGPLGLGLICFPWIAGISKILKVLRHRATDADQLAMLGILVAMIPIAALNLFFERPMWCAPFWIMLAAGYTLSKTVPKEIAGNRLRIAGADAASPWQARLSYPQPRRAARSYAASGQVRKGVREARLTANYHGSNKRR